VTSIRWATYTRSLRWSARMRLVPRKLRSSLPSAREGSERLKMRIRRSWHAGIFLLLATACTTAITSPCPTADELAPVQHEPVLHQSGDSSSLRNVVRVCVLAVDRDSGDNWTSEFIAQLVAAGADIRGLQDCADRTMDTATITIETMQSTCIDCGGCLAGARFANVSVHVGNAASYLYEARWTDTRGGSISQMLHRSALGVVTLLHAGEAYSYGSDRASANPCRRGVPAACDRRGKFRLLPGPIRSE
jgi:hypothetical protein